MIHARPNYNRVANWHERLSEAFAETGDDFTRMVTTLDAEQLHRKFDSLSGNDGGAGFTAWGEKFVYFPVLSDGSEWVGWAPRNPCDIATPHQGQ